MTIKYILAIALITPVLTVSSMAQQYQGGPKSSFMPTRQISSEADIYAQGDVYPRESPRRSPPPVAVVTTTAADRGVIPITWGRSSNSRRRYLVSRPCNGLRGA